MTALRTRLVGALLPVFLAASGLVAQQEPAALRGTWAVAGTSSSGAVYTGTLVLRLEDDGGLSATWRLQGPDGPLARPAGRARVEAGQLVIGGPGPGIAGALQGGGGEERRYDLSTLQGTLQAAGERLARRTRLVILHTNDHHGQVISFLDPTSGRTVGGLAARATLVRREREEAARIGAAVLLLDAGDVNTGVPESDLLDAAPDIAAMGAMGYDAMTVGNHEFDIGLPALQRQRNLASFPFLSANVLRESDARPAFQATQVLERGGLRIGILGLTTESAAFLTLPENRAGLRFEPALECAARWVPKLRAQCDLVLALTHLGYYPDGNFGTSTPGEVNLVRAVAGIDVVVGGHTHTPLPQPVVDSGAIIVQAQDRGRWLGRLDLLLDEQRRIVAHEGRLIPVVVADPSGAVAPVSEDPQILARLQPMLASVAAQLDEVVGTAPALLDGERPHVRAGDTNLAFLVTDAFRAAGGSELAFAIGGGIRSSIAAGEITYREVLTALPFGNGLVRGKLSGAQVLEVLGLGARQVAPAGGWLQVSGLTWTIAGGEAREVRIGGAALDPARLYSVTCDRFIADGGERYAVFSAMQERELLPLVDSDALREFLRANGVPDYSAERRCTVVSGPPAAPAPAPAPVPGH